MCGIAGIVNLSGQIGELPVWIKMMTDTIRHRGPDGEGFLFFNGSEIITAFGKDTPKSVINAKIPYFPRKDISTISGNFILALGHRRLSIIDISEAGHQPMCSINKDIWVVFNGEIYNHIELREELKNKGFSFETNTDTEVVLVSYLYWGKECVKHFNGMWAFVVFDKKINSLFGSRDRFGVKPFYYYKDNNVFAFASEQKALLKLPFIKSGINIQTTANFLAGDAEYIEYGEESFFKNILELSPSHSFCIDLNIGNFKIWNYYKLQINNIYSNFDEKHFIKFRDEVKNLLLNTIKLRLRSDVPIGSCLSGGIDSSVIVSITDYLIHQGYEVNLGGNLKLFTLKFPEQQIDESKWAKYVVDKTKAEWHTITPSANELINDFETLVYSQDIPICTTGTYGQFRLMKRAKEKGIKVMLDGQGGDELFGGYTLYSFVLWNELLKSWKLGKLMNEFFSNEKLFFNLKQWNKEWIKQKVIANLPIILQQKIYHSYFTHYNYLTPQIVNKYIKYSNTSSYKKNYPLGNLNEALLYDFVNTRLKMYLKYEDRCSMWHSVEARTPFVDDHKLIEYVFQIPASYKIHNGINKFLLRESAREFLPKQIVERKDKLGLVTPIEWVPLLASHYRDYFDNSLKDFIQIEKIHKNFEQFFNVKDSNNASKAFKFISFAVWKKTFNL